MNPDPDSPVPWANDRHAPGAPGGEPHWTSGGKAAVGTAVNAEYSGTSLVWFTIAHGIFDEIYYPEIDCACVRNLGMIVTDGSRFFSEEQRHTEHRVEWLAEGVPAFRLTNTCKQGRYRIEKTVLANPYHSAIVQRTRFHVLTGDPGAYRLYALLAPHLGNQGADNSAWLAEHKGMPMLFARRQSKALALALACSTPWLRGSAGFVGVSDGWQGLSRHYQLTECHGRAEGGNVALTGEIDLRASGGEFTLALGFGLNPEEAGHRALVTLLEDFDTQERKYREGWESWQKSLRPPQSVKTNGRDLYRISAAMFRVHESRLVPGATVASLAVPWGETQSDSENLGVGGYHLVWPRDLVETAGGLIAAGDPRAAIRVLDYLRATQEPDGHWPQNMWVGSEKYWDGLQMGETALPILLADHLFRDNAFTPDDRPRLWPMVRRAAAYLVQKGPSTQQDRWENQRGYTPYTLAAVIAALLAAAEHAETLGETTIAAYLRDTADVWCGHIESWLYVTDTPLARRIGVEGYYVRCIPPELLDLSVAQEDRVRLQGDPPEKDGVPVTEITSPDALALVRFGLRAADDPRIVATVRAIDATVKVETPLGPSWHRYVGDGYGEHDDGSPFVAGGGRKGRGRAWPLLTAERAHYELAAGHRAEAVRLLGAVERFAGPGGLIPEQVWDADDIPDRDLYRGRPTGSAMPLVWAHAEYIKLRRSIEERRVFDRPPQAARRYLDKKFGSPYAYWRLDHQRGALRPGEPLRIELPAPATIRWTLQGEDSPREVKTRDTGLGMHVADLPPERTSRKFTIVWTGTQARDTVNFSMIQT